MTNSNFPIDGIVTTDEDIVYKIMRGEIIEIVQPRIALSAGSYGLLSADRAYGIVTFGDCDIRGEKSLKKTYDQHGLSDELRNEIAKGDQAWLYPPFYVWPIEQVTIFDEPIPIEIGERKGQVAKGIVYKLKIEAIDPTQLSGVDDRELLSTHLRLHQLFAGNFAGTDKTTTNGLTREDLINAEIFVQDEFERRGFKHEVEDELTREADKLRARRSKQSLPTDGLIVSSESMAVAIIEGRKTEIIKPKMYDDLEDRDLILLHERKALGVMTLGAPEERSTAQLSATSHKHLITQSVLNDLGDRQPSWHTETYYAWPIVAFEAFDEPHDTNVSQNPQTIARNVQVFGTHREFAIVNPSGKQLGPEIKIDDVLSHFRATDKATLRLGEVKLTGGLANNGKTKGDIDILIGGPVSPELRDIIEFRIGRMLPPKLSSRARFADESEFGGVFTPHYDIADLALIFRDKFERKEMRDIQKQDDPLMDFPKKGGKQPSAFQSHTIGRGAHLDLRMKANGHAIGITLAALKRGTIKEPIDTLAEGRRIARDWKPQGSHFWKPILAPNGLFATPKLRQPTAWLKLDDSVFQEGTTGASKFEEGVIINIDNPDVEFGVQTPIFHEWFFTGGKGRLNGILMMRKLTGQGQAPQEEVDAGRITPEGQIFWRAFLSKEFLPSVLKRRAVQSKRMPPDGYSWIPKTLEDVTPKEFRFWTAKGDDAREMRDSLVESRFFTARNVKMVSGEFRRVEAVKTYYYVNKFDGDTERIEIGKRSVTSTLESNERVRTTDFGLSWQWWKGQTVVRAGPSRQVWHLMLKNPDDGGLTTWMFQVDPLSEKRAISGTLVERKSSDLLSYDGEVGPGQKIGGDLMNDTKATPSTIAIQDNGTAELIEDGETFKKINFKGDKLKGVWTLVAEEAGSKQWQMTPGEDPGRTIPAEKGAFEDRQKLLHAAVLAKLGSYDELIKLSNAELEKLLADVAKRFETRNVRLSDGTVLQNIQVWDPEKVQPDDDRGGERAELEPIALFQPMKPAPRDTNRFTSISDVFERFAAGQMLEDGIVISPKYNGFRVNLQKDSSGRVSAFTEEVFSSRGGPHDLLRTLPSLREEIEGLPGPFVLDGEMVAVDKDGEPVPRRELARFRGKDEVDDSGVRIKAFDVLYLPKTGNITQESQTERERLLKSYLTGKELKHIELAPSKIAKTNDAVRGAIEWATNRPHSEGAMLKWIGATYSLGGESDGWAKLKSTRRVRAIVYGRDSVKDTPGVWNYSCAVGPIDASDTEKWKETVKIGGQTYVPIGITGNSSVKARNGDVFDVDVLELLYTEAEPRTIHWFGPAAIVEKTRQPPMTVNGIINMLRPGERKIKKSLRILKLKGAALEELPDLLRPIKQADGFDLCRDNPFTKDGEQRVVLGVVLEPEVADAQRDIYSEGEVLLAATEAGETLGFMHEKELHGATCLGIYISEKAFIVNEEPVKKGTWLEIWHFKSKKLWERVKAGEFTGFSIGGEAIKEPV